MEYTKDIILDIRYKKDVGITKIKKLITNLIKRIKNHKIILIIWSILTTLIIIDIVLVNSFLEILTKLY